MKKLTVILMVIALIPTAFFYQLITALVGVNINVILQGFLLLIQLASLVTFIILHRRGY